MFRNMGDCQTRQSNVAVPPSESEAVETLSSMITSSASSSTSSLSVFHEDILLGILSFVADTPFEMVGGGMLRRDGCYHFVVIAFLIIFRSIYALYHHQQHANPHTATPH